LKKIYKTKKEPLIVTPLFLSKVVQIPDQTVARVLKNVEETPGGYSRAKTVWKKKGLYYQIHLLS
jgi:hypothetical protein